MEISFEGILALIAIVASATLWVVSAIHGVRDSIKDLANNLRDDIKEHDAKILDMDSRITALEEEGED